MCLFNSNPQAAAPVLPPETAAMQQPDGNAVKTAAERRTAERIGSAVPTVLTSGSGVKTNAPTSRRTAAPAAGGQSTILTSSSGLAAAAPTEKKTLLGQ